MRKFKAAYWICIVLLLQSCGHNPFLNEKTIVIHTLTDGLPWDRWPEFFKEYSTEKITDSAWKEVLNDFKKQEPTTDFLYFSEEPKELIGIPESHNFIGYVYNPDISDRVLSGLDPELDESEKKRIWERVRSAIMKFQPEEEHKDVQNEIDREYTR